MYCSTCNVDSANSLFCHVCDNYLPKAGGGTKANLVSREFALVVNFVFYALLFLSALWIFEASHYSLNAENEVLLKVLIGLAIYLIVSLWPLSRGKTPGKFLMGIRAVDKRNSGLPGIGRMLVRETIGKIVSGAFLSLGYFWAIWDKDSQAWHDKIAGTVVLRQTTESDEYPLRSGDKVALGASALVICICATLLYFNTQSPSRKSVGADAPPRTSTYGSKLRSVTKTHQPISTTKTNPITTSDPQSTDGASNHHIAQVRDPKWDSSCMEGGCLMQTDILRGQDGATEAPTVGDFRDYVSIGVGALNHAPPKFINFHVDPRAQRDSGIHIAFIESIKPLKITGEWMLPMNKCDENECLAMFPNGIVKNDEGGPNLNLMGEFL